MNLLSLLTGLFVALSLLTVLFVALELTHVITWSWWLVLSPTILQLAFGCLFVICVTIADCLDRL